MLAKCCWAGGTAGLISIAILATAVAEDPTQKPRKKLPEISSQVEAERAVIMSRATSPAPECADQAAHPLQPAMKWAREGLANIEKIEDYQATMVKRERINGQLRDFEQMFVKVRHKPFSVYMHFLAPANLKGQEVIYVEGKNNGNLWAHTVGWRDKIVGTLSLPPTGAVAMTDQRYPITETGVLNLVRRLIEVGEYDIQYGECDVKFIKGAKINGRSCTCIQVIHPEPRKEFLFHMARIFVDEELNIAIRYEAWDWPGEAGGKPEMIEEYTYLNLKTNCALTDLDFDIKNPNYKFR